MEAIAGLRDTMASEMRHGIVNMSSFIDIEDGNRQLVTTVRARDNITIQTDGEMPN